MARYLIGSSHSPSISRDKLINGKIKGKVNNHRVTNGRTKATISRHPLNLTNILPKLTIINKRNLTNTSTLKINTNNLNSTNSLHKGRINVLNITYSMHKLKIRVLHNSTNNIRRGRINYLNSINSNAQGIISSPNLTNRSLKFKINSHN